VARSLARRIPGARLQLIDAGHDLAVERPQAAARAVLSFVLDEPERLETPLELGREALP
jgi:pimeloyl-ACP methyl ester carboxylesterase